MESTTLTIRPYAPDISTKRENVRRKKTAKDECEYVSGKGI